MAARRLHITLRVNPSRRVFVTAQRLWGGWNGPHPVIRLQLDPPAGVDWSWTMTCIAREPHQISVPDDWEQLAGQERYVYLRDYLMQQYDARRVQPDRFKADVRKQPRKM